MAEQEVLINKPCFKFKAMVSNSHNPTRSSIYGNVITPKKDTKSNIYSQLHEY